MNATTWIIWLVLLTAGWTCYVIGLGDVSTGQQECKICVSADGQQSPCQCEDVTETDWDNPISYLSFFFFFLAFIAIIIGAVVE